MRWRWLHYPPIVACSFRKVLFYKVYQLYPASYIGLYIDPVRMILDCLQADEKSVRYLFVTKTVTDFPYDIGLTGRYFIFPAENIE